MIINMKYNLKELKKDLIKKLKSDCVIDVFVDEFLECENSSFELKSYYTKSKNPELLFKSDYLK